MSGTRQGGLAAAKKSKDLYGADYHSKIGTIGGRAVKKENRYFYVNREAAKQAGSIGGSRSSRRGVKNGQN